MFNRIKSTLSYLHGYEIIAEESIARLSDESSELTLDISRNLADLTCDILLVPRFPTLIVKPYDWKDAKSVGDRVLFYNPALSDASWTSNLGTIDMHSYQIDRILGVCVVKSSTNIATYLRDSKLEHAYILQPADFDEFSLEDLTDPLGLRPK